METWSISDSMGEWVEYYNPTGHVMVFTRDAGKAWKTTDSHVAWEVAQIAKRVYQRHGMGIRLVETVSEWLARK